MLKRLWSLILLSGLAAISNMALATVLSPEAAKCEGLILGQNLSQWLETIDPEDKITVKIKGTPISDTREFRNDIVTLLQRHKVRVTFTAEGILTITGIQDRISRLLRQGSVNNIFKDNNYQWITDAEAFPLATISNHEQSAAAPVADSVPAQFTRLKVQEFIQKTPAQLKNFDFQVVLTGTQARWIVVQPHFFNSQPLDVMLEILENKSHGYFSDEIIEALVNKESFQSADIKELTGSNGWAKLNAILAEQQVVVTRDQQWMIIPLTKPVVAEETLGAQIQISSKPSPFSIQSTLLSSAIPTINYNDRMRLRNHIIKNGDLARHLGDQTYGIPHLRTGDIRLWLDYYKFSYDTERKVITLLERTSMTRDEEKDFHLLAAMKFNTSFQSYHFANGQTISPPGQNRSYSTVGVSSNVLVKLRLKHGMSEQRLNRFLAQLPSLVAVEIDNDGRIVYKTRENGQNIVIVLAFNRLADFPFVISIHGKEIN